MPGARGCALHCLHDGSLFFSRSDIVYFEVAEGIIGRTKRVIVSSYSPVSQGSRLENDKQTQRVQHKRSTTQKYSSYSLRIVAQK